MADELEIPNPAPEETGGRAAMAEPPSPKARRFRSAAPYYLRGRPTYSPLLIRHVARICGLSKTQRLLDLGCGPGQLAIALAPYVGEVVAVDPEPAMLRLAAEHAAQKGVVIRFIEGSSADLGPALGSFRMVAIGRAFHWMKRAATLARLNRQVTAGGAVVLFRDRHPHVPDNAWEGPYKALLARYAGEDAGRAPHRSPDWLTNEAVLLASPFSDLERISVIERQSTPPETFVDRAFSMSSTSPARLGARCEELAEQVRRLMASHASEGKVSEVVETEALIARRPAAAGRQPA